MHGAKGLDLHCFSTSGSAYRLQERKAEEKRLKEEAKQNELRAAEQKKREEVCLVAVVFTVLKRRVEFPSSSAGVVSPAA